MKFDMDGILLINKKKGITSHDVISIVRKKLNIKKVGHCGTLDPMATGLLIILIGKATKLSDYIMKNRKTYLAKVKLGLLTDSYDITGNILENKDFTVDKDKLIEVLKSFVGDVKQIPPMYSAIKVNGKKLYEYARKGVEVKRKERLVKIHSMELLDFNGKDEFVINCDVSSGTYIRTLAFDIGRKLNTYGTLLELQRNSISNFNLNECLNIDDIQSIDLEELNYRIIPMEKALLNFEKFSYPSYFYDKLLNGIKFQTEKDFEDKIFRLYCRDEFIGLGRMEVDNGRNYMALFKKLIRWEMIVIDIDLNYVAEKNSIIALGNFDGVHKGHRKLLESTVKIAKEKKLKSAVLGFKSHSSNMYSENKKKILTTNTSKFKIFSDLGIDIVYLIDFNKEFMSMSPMEFLKDFLQEKLKVKGLVVGYDYTFAYKKAGDVNYLKEHSYLFNWLDIIEEQTWQGQAISSSLIRKLISEGKIKEANFLLDSNFTVMGKVVHNKGLGQKMGYPTANLELCDNYIIPRYGVYDTDIIVDGKKYKAATSVGTNPTVEDDGIKIEAHILDFNDNIYGKTVELIFLDFIRPELVFKNIDELFKQIKLDVKKVQER